MEDTLAERGGRYGNWRTQAEIAQAIKEAYRTAPQWLNLPAYMRESLDINANKMARALNGDFMYLDNWHDHTNYSKLAEDCLAEDIAAGVKGPVIRDPAHMPFEERLAGALHELQQLGFHFDGDLIVNENEHSPQELLVAKLPAEARVRDPDFLNDPVRAFFGNLNAKGGK